MKSVPFVIETIYRTSVENVWKAITNYKEMRQWHFDVPGFSPVPGFEFNFSSAPSDERSYRHYCQVIESKPLQKLSFTWIYNHYDAVTHVSFELFEEPNGNTRLRLTHKGLEAYPESDPDFTSESFAQGWTWIIMTALKDYLEKTYKPVSKMIKIEA